MKKNLLFLLMLICSMSLFTACNDDDDNGGEGPQLGKDIAGTYNGELSVVSSEAKASRQQVFITPNGANDVTLELKNISINMIVDDNPTSIEIDDIQFPNVAVEGDNTLVQLKESKVVLSHPSLGELEVTAAGTVQSQKLDLNFSVKVKDPAESINVVFAGEKLSSEVDTKDYAQEVAGWYARKELTITGIEIEAKYPNDGIEVVYNKYNQISIKPFYISFPWGTNDTRQIDIKSARLINTATGVEIEDIHQALTDKRGDATLDFSGKFENGVLTLNMTITNEQNTAHYVFTADQKKTGAAIEKMTINSDVIVVQPEIGGVDSNKADIVFYIKEGTSSEKLSLVPEFEISSGATLYYGDAAYVKGTAIDFSKEQTFKVTAESGKTTVTYTVKNTVMQDFSFATNFDGKWEVGSYNNQGKILFDEPGAGWATSNGGVAYIKGMDFILHCYSADKPNAVTPDAGKTGKAARLETLDTKGMASIIPGFVPSVPKVTSGSVFSGVFEVVISNTLQSTKFGYPCLKKPVAFSGTYKFKSGSVYYTCANPEESNVVTVTEGKKDEPALNAVLYEVDSYAFDFLDGTNLLTSEKIVAIASVDGKEQAEYTDFNVNFIFKKDYDATKKYKLAIVCSSSKEGDKFSGAPGSVLYVDDLEVTF